MVGMVVAVVAVIGGGGERNRDWDWEAGTAGVRVDGSVVGAGGGAGLGVRLVACFLWLVVGFRLVGWLVGWEGVVMTMMGIGGTKRGVRGFLQA